MSKRRHVEQPSVEGVWRDKEVERLSLSIRAPLEVCGAQGSVLSASTLSLQGEEGAVTATRNLCGKSSGVIWWTNIKWHKICFKSVNLRKNCTEKSDVLNANTFRMTVRSSRPVR